MISGRVSRIPRRVVVFRLGRGTGLGMGMFRWRWLRRVVRCLLLDVLLDSTD